MTGDTSPIVWFAGTNWDAVAGTDRRIVAAIAERRPVVWIDPADRRGWPGWVGRRAPEETGTAGVTRIQLPAPPGVTQWPARWVTSLLRSATCRRVLRRQPVHAVVVANPITTFPRIAGPRVLYLTDDWEAGAELMGLSRRWVSHVIRRNRRRAHAIAAVSPELLHAVADDAGSTRLAVLPNGAPASPADDGRQRHPVAGLIGQINERLDLTLLEAVVDAGMPLRIVGPQGARDDAFVQRFEQLVARPGVDWVGPVAREDVAEHLAEIAVGLTPYRLTRFNRASSPLKTLEYLSAGVPVVSSDLPSSRWLSTPDIAVCAGPSEFAGAVRAALTRGRDAHSEQRRRAFARRHGWEQRAAGMLDLIDSVRSRDATL